MTSCAECCENARVRESRVAVPASRLPSLAERRTSEASSSAVRAPLSSSFGSTPIARRSVFAELLRKTIAGRNTVVKAHWNGMTSLAVCRGSESAKFFGTSSPTIIDRSVAATIAVTEPTGRTAASGRPIAVRGPASRLEIAGSIV